MKKVMIFILIISLSLLTISCGGGKKSEADITKEELAAKVNEKYSSVKSLGFKVEVDNEDKDGLIDMYFVVPKEEVKAIIKSPDLEMELYYGDKKAYFSSPMFGDTWVYTENEDAIKDFKQLDFSDIGEGIIIDEEAIKLMKLESEGDNYVLSIEPNGLAELPYSFIDLINLISSDKLEKAGIESFKYVIDKESFEYKEIVLVAGSGDKEIETKIEFYGLNEKDKIEIPQEAIDNAVTLP